ncbi:MAG TPA: hypothetical protein VHN14_35395 [Kofleriaceae bacterium]|jgi:hypothetical protein|nr:hypothetical protein [Kofleriaceae bacterium]
MHRDVDLLLLNCSNLPEWPIFPYAFVQVSALARRRGLHVERFDFLGLSAETRARHLRQLIERHRPRMIGITLRQCDTQVDGDYLDPGEAFFPVEDSRDVIRWCRELTDAPVVLGGFGFTSNALQLFDYLEADLGVQGEPDSLFEHFESVARLGELASVTNLIWRDGARLRLAPRSYAPPFDDREYDEQILGELISFYSAKHFFSPDGEQVAVEVMRGCPYRCYFCTEPAVKGTSIRYRDLDVVEGEVEFLARHMVRKLWFVCSELNMGKPDFLRLLAERMIRINERFHDAPLEWNAYYLPRWLSKDDLRLLFRSGFRGGWDDFPSLDDENLKACKVPYRAQDARRHLHQVHELTSEAGIRLRSEGVYSVFLGNSFATPQSISTTLRYFNDSGLTDIFEDAHVRTGTRVYEVCPDTIPIERGSMFTISRGGNDERLLHPSFAYPELLLHDLGSIADVRGFFSLVVSTYLTHAHRRTKDWCWFLARSTTPERLCAFIEQTRRHNEPPPSRACAEEVDPIVRALWVGEPGPIAMIDLFVPPELSPGARIHGGVVASNTQRPLDRLREQEVASALMHVLFASWRDAIGPALASIGLRTDDCEPKRSDYAIHEGLYRRFQSNAEVEGAFCAAKGFSPEGVEVLLLRLLLFKSNLQIDPRYGRWLFGAGAPAR